MKVTCITTQNANPKPVQRPDYWNLYLRETANVPEGWRWFQADTSAKVAPEGFIKLTGVVCPDKRNGQPNWKLRDKSTESIHFIEMAKLRVWIDEYAKSQGKCPKCWNSGLVWAGASVKEGTRYRPCNLCGGSSAKSMEHQ
jgi:hypothetical protein